MATFGEVKNAMFAGPAADAGARAQAFMRNNPTAELICTSGGLVSFTDFTAALWIFFTCDAPVNTDGVNAYRDNSNPANDFD